MPKSNQQETTRAVSVAFRDLAEKLPSVSGYVDGNDSGQAAARAFMCYLAKADLEDLGGGRLQWIVADLIDRSGGSLSAGLHGHVVGLFSELQRFLVSFAKWPGGQAYLAQFDREELASTIAEAEAGVPTANYHMRQAEWRSEKARHAANCRWAKHREHTCSDSSG